MQQNPLDLAAVLLEWQADWNSETIQRAVDSGKTSTVYLDTPLPVLIVYWTVSVGAPGNCAMHATSTTWTARCGGHSARR